MAVPRPSGLWGAVHAQLISRREGNFPALDGLRAIASLLIVVLHSSAWLPYIFPRSVAGLPRWVRAILFNCWVGIDIFFALSGFLIGRMLFLQLARGRIRFRAFYIRRTFRIFPAYYLVLTMSVFLFARLGNFRRLYENAPSAALLQRSWGNYLYVSNYLYGCKIPNPLAWGWSLCIEEHFYLLLPAFLALLFRCIRGSWGRVSALLAVVSLPSLARLILYRHDPLRTTVLDWIYPASHTHADALLLGVLIAYGVVHHHESLARVVRGMGMLMWVAAVASFGAVFQWGGLLSPGFFPVVLQFLVLGCAASLLVMNALFLDDRITRFLSHPGWYPLARVSYGTYLIHHFLLFWVLTWWPHAPYGTWGSMTSLVGFTVVVVLVTTAAAAVLFLLLERPMLDWGARLSQSYLRQADSPVAAAPSNTDEKRGGYAGGAQRAATQP